MRNPTTSLRINGLYTEIITWDVHVRSEVLTSRLRVKLEFCLVYERGIGVIDLDEEAKVSRLQYSLRELKSDVIRRGSYIRGGNKRLMSVLRILVCCWFVEFEVFAAVVMKSSIFWYTV
jgi:hypothetical protein